MRRRELLASVAPFAAASAGCQVTEYFSVQYDVRNQSTDPYEFALHAFEAGEGEAIVEWADGSYDRRALTELDDGLDPSNADRLAGIDVHGEPIERATEQLGPEALAQGALLRVPDDAIVLAVLSRSGDSPPTAATASLDCPTVFDRVDGEVDSSGAPEIEGTCI